MFKNNFKKYRFLSILLIELFILNILIIPSNLAQSSENLPPVANPALDPKKHPIANSVMILEPVFFTAIDSYDPNGEENLTYFWNFGDGVTSNQMSPTHIYNQIGEYTVSLTVNDSLLSDKKVLTIIAISERHHNPVAKIIHNINKGEKGNFFANVSESILFDASSSYDPDGSALTYEWDFGDGEISLHKIVTHEFRENNVYTVTLTVIDDETLISKDSITVIIGTGSSSIEKEDGDVKREVTNLGLIIAIIVVVIVILLVIFWMFLNRLRKRAASSALISDGLKSSYDLPKPRRSRVRREAPQPEFSKPEVSVLERSSRQLRAEQLGKNEARLKQAMLKKKIQEERKKVDDDMKKELGDLGIDV